MSTSIVSSGSVAKPAAPKPAKKASVKPKKPSDHPKYTTMVSAAVGHLKERGGSSRQAILKYIMSNYNVGKEERVVNQHLKMALKAGVKSSGLKQSRGTGASGSFTLCTAKGSSSKTKTGTPKKARKPSGTNKGKSPKKATRKVAKSSKKTATKKPAAKKLKSPAKAKKAVRKVSKTTTAKKPKSAAKPKKAPAKKLAKKA